MLTRLSISNYALISSLDIEFPDGLIIITGETGAGKSILLGALSLLLGKRADSSVFSDNTKNCVVEAEFTDKDGEDIILRRVITPSGRSRSFMNDEPVTLSELSAISGRIIDVHAQHQHLLLTDPDYRLSVIDHFAGNTALLEEYGKVYAEYERLDSEMDELRRSIAEAERDKEYRQFQLERLQDAGLKHGEMEALEEEQRVLAHAEDIKSGLEAAYSAVNPGELSVSGQLKDAASRLSKYVAYDSRLEQLSGRLESCRIEVDDIEQEIMAISSDITVSPERLAQVEDRMSLIHSLMRKYGCQDVEELIAERDALAAAVSGTEGMQQKPATTRWKRWNLMVSVLFYGLSFTVFREVEQRGGVGLFDIIVMQPAVVGARIPAVEQADHLRAGPDDGAVAVGGLPVGRTVIVEGGVEAHAGAHAGAVHLAFVIDHRGDGVPGQAYRWAVGLCVYPAFIDSVCEAVGEDRGGGGFEI